jgi:hypothetical protein
MIKKVFNPNLMVFYTSVKILIQESYESERYKMPPYSFQ